MLFRSLLADQIRRAVNKFDGVLDPTAVEQINALELKNTGEAVGDIKTRLLDVFNKFNTLYNDEDYNTREYSKLYNDVGNYTSYLIDYNKLVGLYLSSANNAGTTQAVRSAFMETEQLKRFVRHLWRPNKFIIGSL